MTLFVPPTPRLMKPGSRLSAFTFPEVLVNMGLLVLFAVLAGGLYFQGRSFAMRQDREARILQEKVSLAKYLPELCQQILPPEWVPQGQVFFQTAEGYQVTYRFAEASQSLSFVTSHGFLEVRGSENTWAWKSLGPMELAWWKNSERIVGLKVQWMENGVKQWLHIPWGARPL